MPAQWNPNVLDVSTVQHVTHKACDSIANTHDRSCCHVRWFIHNHACAYVYMVSAVESSCVLYAESVVLKTTAAAARAAALAATKSEPTQHKQ